MAVHRQIGPKGPFQEMQWAPRDECLYSVRFSPTRASVDQSTHQRGTPQRLYAVSSTARHKGLQIAFLYCLQACQSKSDEEVTYKRPGIFGEHISRSSLIEVL